MKDTRSRDRWGSEMLQKAVIAITVFPKCMVVLVFGGRISSISFMVVVNFVTVPSVSSANTLFNPVRHLGPRGGGNFVLTSYKIFPKRSREDDIGSALIERRPRGRHGRPPRQALLQHAGAHLPLVPRENQSRRRQTRLPRPPWVGKSIGVRSMKTLFSRTNPVTVSEPTTTL
jgi:hypothetical protein